jgi:hypothetical protein
MPLMQFYAVTGFELSWDYIVSVGLMWWFYFCAGRHFGGNYRLKLHRHINFSTLEVKTFGTSEMFVFMYQSTPRQHIL